MPNPLDRIEVDLTDEEVNQAVADWVTERTE